MEELARSFGRGVAKILSQSQSGAVWFARHDRIPDPKSSVSL